MGRYKGSDLVQDPHSSPVQVACRSVVFGRYERLGDTPYTGRGRSSTYII